MLRGPGGIEPLIFGSGEQGSVLLDVDGTLLVSEFYAEDITVTGHISTNGFRLFARDFIRISPTGSLLAFGGNAVNKTGGIAPGGVIVDGGIDGGAGHINANGSPGSDVNITIGGFGGTGGDSSAHTGGVGGTFVGSTLNSEYNLLCPLLGGAAWDGTSPFAKLSSGTGGGAGGGTGAAFSGGGGGGAPGGGIILAAPLIENHGLIDAHGGNGANGINGFATDSGGGGGGGGGWVMLVYSGDLINDGTITVDGGNGGNHFGGGALGGTAGTGGRIIHYTNGYLAVRTEFGTAGTDGV